MDKQRTSAGQRAFDLEERLLIFAIRACEICDNLPNTRLGLHIAGQLMRASTSPPPNYGEAQSAESRRDFIHKLKICLKELREVQIWLRFIKMKRFPRVVAVEELIIESDELISIFVKSVATAQKNLELKRGTRSKITNPCSIFCNRLQSVYAKIPLTTCASSTPVGF